MSQTKIHLLINIREMTLVVFHTEAHCWQWRLLSKGGEVFGENKIYYSASAAEKAGRDWIAEGR